MDRDAPPFTAPTPLQEASSSPLVPSMHTTPHVASNVAIAGRGSPAMRPLTPDVSIAVAADSSACHRRSSATSAIRALPDAPGQCCVSADAGVQPHAPRPSLHTLLNSGLPASTTLAPLCSLHASALLLPKEPQSRRSGRSLSWSPSSHEGASTQPPELGAHVAAGSRGRLAAALQPLWARQAYAKLMTNLHTATSGTVGPLCFLVSDMAARLEREHPAIARLPAVRGALGGLEAGEAGRMAALQLDYGAFLDAHYTRLVECHTGLKADATAKVQCRDAALLSPCQEPCLLPTGSTAHTTTRPTPTTSGSETSMSAGHPCVPPSYDTMRGQSQAGHTRHTDGEVKSAAATTTHPTAPSSSNDAQVPPPSSVPSLQEPRVHTPPRRPHRFNSRRLWDLSGPLPERAGGAWDPSYRGPADEANRQRLDGWYRAEPGRPLSLPSNPAAIRQGVAGHAPPVLQPLGRSRSSSVQRSMGATQPPPALVEPLVPATAATETTCLPDPPRPLVHVPACVSDHTRHALTHSARIIRAVRLLSRHGVTYLNRVMASEVGVTNLVRLLQRAVETELLQAQDVDRYFSKAELARDDPRPAPRSNEPLGLLQLAARHLNAMLRVVTFLPAAQRDVMRLAEVCRLFHASGLRTAHAEYLASDPGTSLLGTDSMTGRVPRSGHTSLRFSSNVEGRLWSARERMCTHNGLRLPSATQLAAKDRASGSLWAAAAGSAVLSAVQNLGVYLDAWCIEVLYSRTARTMLEHMQSVIQLQIDVISDIAAMYNNAPGMEGEVCGGQTPLNTIGFIKHAVHLMTSLITRNRRQLKQLGISGKYLCLWDVTLPCLFLADFSDAPGLAISNISWPELVEMHIHSFESLLSPSGVHQARLPQDLVASCLSLGLPQVNDDTCVLPAHDASEPRRPAPEATPRRSYSRGEILKMAEEAQANPQAANVHGALYLPPSMAACFSHLDKLTTLCVRDPPSLLAILMALPAHTRQQMHTLGAYLFTSRDFIERALILASPVRLQLMLEPEDPLPTAHMLPDFPHGIRAALRTSCTLRGRLVEVAVIAREEADMEAAWQVAAQALALEEHRELGVDTAFASRNVISRGLRHNDLFVMAVPLWKAGLQEGHVAAV